ncbi:cyclic nucleotide-degrading phosphodiesterase [Gordonia rubripertincta]|uniref:MBL fold metallo-hydrolase n=1 Tax=Gordonia rubripertincta TaxID=36822 RepID=A0AAW4GBE8_GORRU|nr:cyclic nucleotide-degrading phosphodiesterase [Gordonia rubripertincta]MBM7280231.1 MBL fold metallo-hydrolase [Gordonia rubripertincta]QMU20173.1 MBL fold metallo-hydrolase [Gordonia rubripertincta]TSD95547.1 MBL fold metallo-hydrolase [Gordonia rubripertincta]
MRLTVLGCSGSVGGPGAACSGYLLSVPGEQPVLLDCGPGVFGELQRVTDPNSVAVVLSHLHADHCLDLPAMLVWRRYAPSPAKERAPLYGPPGTALRIGYGSSEFPGQVDDISDTFDVQEWRDGLEVTLGGMRIKAMNVNHPPSTFGLRITGPEGQVIAYSGDTAPCDELIDLAADADLFLCEASWTHSPSERPPDLHLSGIEAGEAATKANARALAITHIAPWTDSAEILAEARSTFSGPVDLVRQGQVIELA